jgi:single-strand DNA-binding protein
MAARTRSALPVESDKDKTMLRIDVIGNLGGEPEVRRTQNDREMVQFSVAVNQRTQNASGEWEDKPTEWLRVRAMGASGQRARSLAKGDRVFVAGRLDITHFTSRDGEARTGFEVWADEVSNLGRRASTEDGRGPRGGAGAYDLNDDAEGDLPF